jgi:hypothetical protein
MARSYYVLLFLPTLAFVDGEVFTGRSVELELLRNLVNDALAGIEPQAAELRLALLAAKSTALARKHIAVSAD